MAVAARIHHNVNNQTWVRPQIGYDAWKMINDYARQHKMDFPSAADVAARMLTRNEVTDGTQSANV